MSVRLAVLLLLFTAAGCDQDGGWRAVQNTLTRFRGEVKNGPPTKETTTDSFDANSRAHRVLLDRIRTADGVDLKTWSVDGERACVGAAIRPGGSYVEFLLEPRGEGWKVARMANAPGLIGTCKGFDDP